MDREDFLKILKPGFHKPIFWILETMLGTRTPFWFRHGIYLGTLKPNLPRKALMPWNIFDHGFMDSFMKKCGKKPINYMTKVFTRKVYDDDDPFKKIVIKCIFGLVSKNMDAFWFDSGKKSMRFVVKGSCLETSS